MACLKTLWDDIIDDLNTKRVACDCPNTIPLDWCEEAGGALGLLYEAALEMLVFCYMEQSVSYPNPGPPTGCPTLAYLTALQEWINGWSCGTKPECPVEFPDDCDDRTSISTDYMYFEKLDNFAVFQAGTYTLASEGGVLSTRTGACDSLIDPCSRPDDCDFPTTWGMRFYLYVKKYPPFGSPFYSTLRSIRPVAKLTAVTGDVTYIDIQASHVTYDTEAAAIAALDGLEKVFEIAIPSRIELGLIATPLGDQGASTYWTLYPEAPTDPAVLSLSPCPNRCTPDPVILPTYTPIPESINATFTWDFESAAEGYVNCAMFYRIYVKALGVGEDCTDCADVVFVPADEYHEELYGDSTSATVLALASGFYCARIDAVVEFDDATEEVAEGDVFCFEADCLSPYPETTTSRPYEGQQIFTDESYITDASVFFRVNYRRATNLKIIVQDQSTGIPQTIYDEVVVASDVWDNVDHYETLDIGVYDFWSVAENLCGETVTSPVSVFRVKAKPGSGCSSGNSETITSWSVINGGPAKDLTPYINAGSNFNTWRIRESSFNTTFNTGNITGGVLVGLAAISPWSPPFYGYTGYMRLERVC
jgi:hypothetical protein